MSNTVAVTARIPAEDKDRLEALAASTGRSKGFLITNAIHDYLDSQSWQIEEIHKAIKEADAGDFATDEEVEAFFARRRV